MIATGYKHIGRNTSALIVAMLYAASTAGAGPSTPAQTPLFVATAAAANIVLLLDDSGSMRAIAPAAPYDPDTTYACPAAALLPASSVGRLYAWYRPADGYAQFYWYTPSLSWGGWGEWGDLNYYGSDPQYCFDPAASYNAYLASHPGDYSGNYLNWYFGPYDGDNPFGAGATRKPVAVNRMEAAQQAAIQLLDSLNNVRVGVAGFNWKSGAEFHHQVADLAANETTIKNAVNGLTASNWTPLAEALHDIGRYFMGFSGATNPGNQESACTVNGQYDGPLTLHPDGTAQTKDDDTVFHHIPALASGVSGASPICYWCQKNFVVLLTDGKPYYDHNISSSSGLQDYDGDCAGSDCSAYDRKSGHDYGTYGSDYLDDVAQAMYQMDLRPDIDDLDGEPAKNNVVTYTVGFAIDHPLLSDTATQSGGLYYTTDNADDLNQAFVDIARDITEQIGAAAGAAFSSSVVEAGSLLFLTQFNSADWSGDLLAFELDQDGNVAATATWSAKESFESVSFNDPAESTRVAYSWDLSTGGSNDGILMKNSHLNPAGNGLLADYQSAPDGSSEAPLTAAAAARLAYLLGSRAHEGPASDYDFRARNVDSIMGDIVHSQPVYVGAPTLQWPDSGAFDYGAGQHYSDFVSAFSGRAGTVYAGGNTGALHAFSADTGEEVLAYFPAHLASSDINGGYHYLTDPGYTHHYYVDGSPVVSDAYVKASPAGAAAWRSVLVGSDGAGGKGLFALDVTDPGNFKKKNLQKARQVVLWEFSDADDPNLGYTVSEPTIALLNNGRWAAIFGNGYGNAGSGKAELFILYLDGGLDGKWSEGWDNDYFRITTGSGSPKYPNGLWTPAVIDLDGDHIADRVYAGSWWGQMWAFDLSSKYPKDWKVAHKGKPLFTAKGEIKGQNEQPITTRPQIIRHPCSSGGFEPNLLVLFGTGQYLVDADDDPYLVDSERQSFYGVWDQGDGGLHRVNLQKQVFLPGSGASGRVIAAKEVGYDGTGGSLKHGWYIDLDPGERVVSDYLVRGKAVYFNTQIPDDRLCAFGGSGWLMSVNTCDGGSPASPEFDYNGDGKIDPAKDSVVIAGTHYGFAGKKFASSKGIPAAPAIIGNKRYTTGTRASGDPNTQMDVNVIADLEAGLVGRLSWDQVFP